MAARDFQQLGPGAPGAARIDEHNLLAALAWAAAGDPELADCLLTCLAQFTERQPSRRAIDFIRDLVAHHPGQWGSEALARAGLAVSYLSIDAAEQIAGQSRLAAATDRDRAYAGWVTGWVCAYRHQESAALRCLDPVIAYAGAKADRWLEASAWQARGLARTSAQDAFADWERSVAGFAAAGDLLHANNVRYMLAGRAVSARARLGEVPVWLGECEAYAARHGYQHELAHIHLTRATYERISGNLAAARPLIDSALPVFRNAGDLRCVSRSLLELAAQASAPAAAERFLLQALHPAATVGPPALRARILAGLIPAAAATGNVVLAARCLGALSALGDLGELSEGEQPVPIGPDITRTLAAPAYTSFVSEGRSGGIDLIAALYPG